MFISYKNFIVLDDLIKKRNNKILNEFIFVIFGKKHNKHKI